MRILDKKEKNAIPVQTGDGKVYLKYDKDAEGEYLRFAADLILRDIPRVVYKDDPHYYFLTRKNNEIEIEHREIDNVSTATFEIDEFFESRETFSFEASKVARIKLSPFSNRKVVLAVLVLGSIAATYFAFRFMEPKKYIPMLTSPVAPKVIALTDTEKKELVLIGNKMLVEKISEIISDVRADTHQRIDTMSVQKTDNPQSIQFIITSGKQYDYPEIGTNKTADGVYGKTVTDTISLERKDARVIETADFDSCAMRMLEGKFDVKSRDEACASMTYENSAQKMIDVFGNLVHAGCNLNFDDKGSAFTISNDKGKLNVALCK